MEVRLAAPLTLSHPSGTGPDPLSRLHVHSSFVARGPPNDQVFTYDINYDRFGTRRGPLVGVLSARLDAVLGKPQGLTAREVPSAVQELVDDLDDVDNVERYFPAEGISARLGELCGALAPLIRQFAALCEVPTVSGPLETLLALELDGIFEPAVDSVLSRSPLMLERAVSSQLPGTVGCEALSRVARALKASKPGVDELYATSLEGQRERGDTWRTGRAVFGLQLARARGGE